MKWEFSEDTGTRCCSATSWPYGTYLMYTACAFLALGFCVLAFGGDSKPAMAFGFAFMVCSLPVLGLSFFTNNPVTTLKAKEGTLTVDCVYRFSKDTRQIPLNSKPEIKVTWHSNPIMFTPGGPGGGRGIWHIELAVPEQQAVHLGESQSKEELEAAAQRMTEWVLAAPRTSPIGDAADGATAPTPPRADDIPQGVNSPRVVLAIAVMVMGIFGMFWGTLQYYASRDCAREAVEADLAALEAGQQPPNFHIELGEHMAVYDQAMVSRRGRGEVDKDTRIQWVKYPILSRQNPFFRALGRKARQYGGVKNIPADDYPAVESFAVLVLTRQFKRFGNIPDVMEKKQSITGLIINSIAPLTSTQQKLMEEHFPAMAGKKVWILEAGRRPYALSTCYTLIGGGFILICVAIAFGWSCSAKKKED